jgi:hypothetical protein
MTKNVGDKNFLSHATTAEVGSVTAYAQGRAVVGHHTISLTSATISTRNTGTLAVGSSSASVSVRVVPVSDRAIGTETTS